jgi:hypothetical protein
MKIKLKVEILEIFLSSLIPTLKQLLASPLEYSQDTAELGYFLFNKSVNIELTYIG